MDIGRRVLVQRDGRLVVTGWANNGSTFEDFAAARYLSNGSLDTSFGNAGRFTVSFADDYDNASDAVLQPDGEVVLAGWTPTGSSNDMALARLNPDGSLDATFDGDGRVTLNPGPLYDRLWAVALAPDGGIVGAGHQTARRT